MANTGTGATITFGTSAFSARFTMIGGLAEEIPTLDDTDLSSSGYEEKVPGDLKSLEPIECELFWVPGTTSPPVGTVETITITYPNGATLAGSGFTARKESPELTPDGRLKGRMTIQFDGKTGPVVAS